ncbi:MAG: response regulator [Candidatus Eremiobacteraeota bacterium]|nr:response regulator [Candidatus Eremiobacteraeota bacterium]
MLNVSETLQNPVRVLLVDDCRFLRTALTGLLGSDHRIQVVAAAENGQQALLYVEQFRPDVVVTDLEMPVMDGAEFVSQQMGRRRIPIIVFSAVAPESPLALRARQAGATHFLCKPRQMADVGAQQESLKSSILAAYGLA